MQKSLFKITCIIIIFLLAFFSRAQELTTSTLLSPSVKGTKDLGFLTEEIKDKRLVLLGELTHQYGTIFEMKARVIEYLHQELGYTTIAMESPIYDLWKMNGRDEFSIDIFNEAIYGVWTNTKEFQRLVNYIEKNKLKVIGFDSQFNNVQNFIDDFFEYCETFKMELKLDEDDMAIIIEAVLNDSLFDESDISFKLYEKELQRLIKRIEDQENTDFHYYWKQFVKSLLASSRDVYFNGEEIPSYDFVNHQHNIRDAQMADNILSYMARNPTEKIVVWADNIHVINDMGSVNKSVVKDFIPMGKHIKDVWGDQVYSLATVHANDSITYQKKWNATPILETSFEGDLKKIGSPFLFISSNQEAMKKPQKHRLLSYVNFMESRLDQLFDGYIFLREALDATPKIDKSILEKEVEEMSLDTIKANIVETEDAIVISGKIIDAHTKMPIPYATIILKKEEIYRVADENGTYSIAVSPSIYSNAAVEISSMGFEKKRIPLKNLKEQVKLVPGLENLEEVTVTGFRTPMGVMKEAIKTLKKNHPITPFNSKRYSKILMNTNDQDILDIDLITADYDQGYRQQNRSTQRVDEVRWNKNLLGKNVNNTQQIFQYRQNPIRYSNILHRRKFKKFQLNFLQSLKEEESGFYIINFQTERNKWNYTNRGYPTKYSGQVFIDKISFAIAKVVESWETTLNKSEIQKYGSQNGLKKYKNAVEVKIKEEYTAVFSQMEDEKYYATTYFGRTYTDYVDKNGKEGNIIYELQSSLFDISTKNIQVIDYDHYHQNESLLRRVQYDKTFWGSFDLNRTKDSNF